MIKHSSTHSAHLIRPLARLLLTTCLLSASVSFAEVSLSGIVTDTLNHPIPNAIVLLKSQNLSDTTDAAGQFSLGGSTPTLAQSKPQTAFAELRGNRLSFTLVSSKHVAVEVFNAKGAMLSRVVDKVFVPGAHTVAIPVGCFAQGVLFVKVSLDGLSETVRMNGDGGSVMALHDLSPKRESFARAFVSPDTAAIDSLVVICEGYDTTYYPLISYVGSGLVVAAAEKMPIRYTIDIEFRSMGGVLTPGDSLTISNMLKAYVTREPNLRIYDYGTIVKLTEFPVDVRYTVNQWKVYGEGMLLNPVITTGQTVDIEMTENKTVILILAYGS